MLKFRTIGFISKIIDSISQDFHILRLTNYLVTSLITFELIKDTFLNSHYSLLSVNVDSE